MDFCNKIYQTVQYDTWATITNQKLKSYNNEKYLILKITVSRDTVHYYQVSVCQIVPFAENFVARRHCHTSHCHSCTLSDPTSDLVRQYEFPVPLRCRKTSDTVFVVFVRPLSEPVRRFSSCSRDFSQQIAQVVLFLFLYVFLF